MKSSRESRSRKFRTVEKQACRSYDRCETEMAEPIRLVVDLCVFSQNCVSNYELSSFGQVALTDKLEVYCSWLGNQKSTVHM